MAKRLYSLYQREGRRWNRIRSGAYPKEIAVRVFQDSLLNACFAGIPECQLRPIKGTDELVVTQNLEPRS